MLFTQQDFDLCLFFFYLLFIPKIVVPWVKYQPGVAYWSVSYRKRVMLFRIQGKVKNFTSWVYFVFILYFIDTIMTTCGSSSIYFRDKADFRVPGPKRSQLYLTMCILIVTFSFPDTYEHSENQLSLFHSWNKQQIREYLWR